MIIKDLEKQLKALANKRRLAIIAILKKNKVLGVGDISREIKLSLKSTSKHLIILHRANLLERTQQKLVVYYFLPKEQNSLLKTILTLL